MARVLVVGSCPLPFENERRLYGPGIRTWQFTKPLLAGGHQVCLVTSRIHGAYPGATGPTVREDGRLTHHVVDDTSLQATDVLQRIHDALAPDCVVAATMAASWAATRLRTPVAIWADAFGDVMSEAQAKAFVHDDDMHLWGHWRMLRAVLDRADVLSSVSERQAYALIGALGTRGRLNKHSLGYRFVHTIPCGVDAAPLPPPRPVLRGREVGGEDFVVLWSGSYNTWTDVDLLFAALEAAMARDPRIRFASTGGQVEGHDERTYPRLLALIRASRFADRFVMKGWLPTQEVPDYWAAADVGIHLDRPIYERELGSQNRVLSWMRAGLPVLCSEISELSSVIKAHGLGFTFPPNDRDALADAIVGAAGDTTRRRNVAERARDYVLTHFTYEATTKPLVAWVAGGRPERAADHGRRVPLERDELRTPWRRHAGRFVESVRLRGILSTGRAVARSLCMRVRARYG
jgi:glycosyltransferase involved in cell wall biosynthesis